jgi:hypothetical protein
MRTVWAILGGAALIAAAVLFIFRWEIIGSGEAVYRVDRWTGQVVSCAMTRPFEFDCGSELVKFAEKAPSK